LSLHTSEGRVAGDPGGPAAALPAPSRTPGLQHLQGEAGEGLQMARQEDGR